MSVISFDDYMLQRSEEAQLLATSEHEAICSCTALLMFRPMQRIPTCLNLKKVLVTAYAVAFDGLKISDNKLHQLPSTLNLHSKPIGVHIWESRCIK